MSVTEAADTDVSYYLMITSYKNNLDYWKSVSDFDAI